MLSEKSLSKLLLELLPKKLPGYTFEEDYDAGAWKISLLGKVETPDKILRQAFIQIETEPNFVKENIEAHVDIRNNLLKKGYLHEEDEYWIVESNDVDIAVKEFSKDSGIALKDRRWILDLVEEYKDDEGVRYAVQTLEAAGAWNP